MSLIRTPNTSSIKREAALVECPCAMLAQGFGVPAAYVRDAVSPPR